MHFRSMCRSKTSLLEATVKRQQNRATCFATLPQNVLTAMMRVLPPTFKPVLQQIKVAASCLNTDVWLDKITREPCTGFTSLAARQVCLGPVKRATCTDLLQKVELFSSFCKNFWQPATAWFVARRVWVGVILTSNSAMPLILQQFCQIVLPYLKFPTAGLQLTLRRPCWLTRTKASTNLKHLIIHIPF